MDKIEIGEYWKDIKGYENYKISNLGRVYSKPRERTKGGILKECISKYGYSYVNLWDDGKMRRIAIHKLVAENFISKPILEVNHIDGNKQNNCIDNLEYVTKRENILHRFRVLKQKPVRKYDGIDWNTKEGINKYYRMYYQKNKKKILEYGREWRKNNINTNKTAI